MTILLHIAAVLIAVVQSTSPAAQQAAPVSPVGIVSHMSGTASVTAGLGPAVALKLYDWIPPDATIEVATKSSVTLVLVSGKRFELSEHVRASIRADRVSPVAGAVRLLDPLPALPAIAPIAKSAQTRGEAAAIRIRGERIGHLYPADPAAALADRTVLRFEPVAGAAKYRLEVEDERGAGVAEFETSEPAVAVSAGVLAPGRTYYWRVSSLDSAGSPARGAAQFATLSEENAVARRALRAALENTGDPRSLALLAEIDRALGLMWEARETLQEAARKAPDDPDIRSALERIERHWLEQPGGVVRGVQGARGARVPGCVSPCGSASPRRRGETGVDDGVRTRDFRSHSPALYR